MNTWPAEEAAQRQEELFLARYFLSRMSERRQMAVRMWSMGVDQQEIAARLGMTRQGAWYNISEALKEIRRNFRQVGVKTNRR